MMTNTITLMKIEGGVLKPDTGLTVQVYNWNASDVAGFAPNGSLIGAAAELGASGQYTFEMTTGGKRITVVVGSLCRQAMIGLLANGDNVPDNSVATASLEGGAVTPVKTSFADNF